MYKEVALLYDAVIGEMPYAKWTKDIITLLKKHNHTPKLLLDLACGTGNHLEHFTKKFSCIGVDKSKTMLQIAKTKVDNVKFYEQDMRKLNITEKPDTIVCLYDSINNLKTENDLLKTFKAVRKTLSENGIFIFDVITLKAINEIIETPVQAGSVGPDHYIWHNTVKNNNWHWTFTSFIKTGKNYSMFEEDHIEYYHNVKKLISLVKQSGFNILQTQDSYTLKNVNKETERINFICKKK
ncbi:methyltransferase domain-containing protein [Candidatus Woesearchaeota archaeon]|nr:methyltransferase domain-containing protein [Candidatus Woesearchaeota archaeon]